MFVYIFCLLILPLPFIKSPNSHSCHQQLHPTTAQCHPHCPSFHLKTKILLKSRQFLMCSPNYKSNLKKSLQKPQYWLPFLDRPRSSRLFFVLRLSHSRTNDLCTCFDHLQTNGNNFLLLASQLINGNTNFFHFRTSSLLQLLP